MKTAQEIYDDRFKESQGRTPRSEPYKRGWKEQLLRKIEGMELVTPYKAGTVEFDAYCAGIDAANNQLAYMKSCGEEIEKKELIKNVSEKKIEEVLQLGLRTWNCLKALEVHTVNDLLKLTERDLLRTPNFGRKTLNELKKQLELNGLKLKSGF